MKTSSLICTILGFFFLLGCGSKPKKETPVEESSNATFNTELGIEAVPVNLGEAYTSNFERYTKVVAPNGKPIHIVIQDCITDAQAVRCRGILEHFLADYPGSQYGSDKGEIANKMADNKAVLVLLNGKDDGKNPVEVPGQALFEEEIQVEGHPWYVNQNYEHRDAAYEEILHFVHDFGIGVDGHNSFPGAAPEFQQEIRKAQVNGLENKLWAGGEREQRWIDELAEENSLSQEYLASVIDTYYGLWGAFSESDGGMWGVYAAKTRDDLESKDPMGHKLMDNKFFHPYLTYNARIDEGFMGTFSLKFDPEIPYSHHSRYLKDITLLGSKDVNVHVNELDNAITGNSGKNVVIFSGNQDEYTITNVSSSVVVSDKIEGRDGSNTLKAIEELQFLDGTLEL
ncbi:hypothetical protein [Ulvibacterium sp.]|uniref:hypothetical protein n=1 Tax=Ulvibacterium sp. TaxID=2665914 RepID=UPI002635D9EC|nr:hypothetical protein [Ulvibacterium sp.]